MGDIYAENHQNDPAPAALTMDDNHWNTLKNLLDAVTELPGVADRVEAFMQGRGIEDPHAEIQALIDISGA